MRGVSTIDNEDTPGVGSWTRGGRRGKTHIRLGRISPSTQREVALGERYGTNVVHKSRAYLRGDAVTVGRSLMLSCKSNSDNNSDRITVMTCPGLIGERAQSR